MNKIKWLYNRLLIMSVSEVINFRIPQFIQHFIKGRYQVLARRQDYKLRTPLPTSFFDWSQLNKLELSDFVWSEVFCFDQKIDLSQEINWRTDYKNNLESPVQYYAKIKKQSFEIHGDVKYISQLSRLHFLPFWAIQSELESDDELGNKVWSVLNKWQSDNPFLYSINWTSGIEVAIRVTNIVYALEVMGMLTPDNWKVVPQNVKDLIFDHYRFLKTHLSKFSSANNHLMAELMGLLVLESRFDLSKDGMLNWKNEFERQVLIQVDDEGVNVELAAGYHAEVLDQIIIGIHHIKLAGYEVDEAVQDRMLKMYDFSRHLARFNIEDNFGDCDDGGVILSLFKANTSILASQVSLFSSPQLDVPLDVRNWLLFGSWNNVPVAKGGDLSDFVYYKNSGFIFSVDPSSKTRFTCFVGGIGDELSGAHGHSDILHFTLSRDGHNILVDSGTYQYHSRLEKYRNYFRGISAHNTVSVFGNNHAQINNRMSWRGRPEVKIESIENSSDTTRIVARVKNVRNDEIWHERELTWDKIAGEIHCKDQLKSTNEEPSFGSGFLNFNPSLKLEQSLGDKIEFSDDARIISLQLTGSKVTYHSGAENPYLGWYSPSFGVLEKGHCCSYELHNNTSVELKIKY